MTGERQPLTVAGRRMLDLLDRHGITDDLNLSASDILDIEAEAEAEAASGDTLRRLREWAKDVVRSVPAVPIRDTDAVPTFKCRVTACIDRAAVLLALEHAAAPVLPGQDVPLVALRQAAYDALDANPDDDDYALCDRIVDGILARLSGEAVR